MRVYVPPICHHGGDARRMSTGQSRCADCRAEEAAKASTGTPVLRLVKPASEPQTLDFASLAAGERAEDDS